MNKQEIRKQMLADREALTPEQVRERSRIICDRIRDAELYRECASLCLYMPIRNEVEADLLIGPALEDGKRVYIPKVVGEEMIFNRYDADLIVEGAFHIRESASQEILEPDETTLIILPGSVFDLNRHRIGYGGGFYDKFLAKPPGCRTIAAAFDLQVIEELPVEAHDISPELIVTEKRVI